MQSLHVNGYDMAYLEVGQKTQRGAPLVCVHGTLGDFRTWYSVLAPLSKKHRVISVSLRHFFPEHWDGSTDTYSLAQHIEDMIAFIEQLGTGPVDLMGAIASSAEGQSCYAQRWVTYAYGRDLTSQDVCTVQSLAGKMAQGTYTILNLVTDLTQSQSFRTRAKELP